MDNIWFVSALWMALAFVAAIGSLFITISAALFEIVIGAIAGNTVGLPLTPWIDYIAAFGAVVLTFLAGTDIDPHVVKRNFGSSVTIGLMGFFAPYLGCLLLARYGLGWPWPQAQIAGISLSTTSVAVVYAVMLEYGFNKTEYGKIVLAACFIKHLGTVLALGFIFAPFTLRTLLFAGVSVAVFVALPWLTPRLFPALRQPSLRARDQISAAGAVRAGSAGGLGGQRSRAAGVRHRHGARRNRGQGSCADPAAAHARARDADAVYFIRAGSFVSVAALIAAPVAFFVLLASKMLTKFVGIYPITKVFGSPQTEAMYTTLLMSTGLTFGTISALFGLSHGIIDQAQYSVVVAGVVASAVIPTLIANWFFLPHHLLPQEEPEVAADTGPTGHGSKKTD